tara:strand:+ start:383 stop:631 length:249 start_codon:yes stop_codon:yes gene_type:complete
MSGYVIERQGVSWDERFWIDIPSVGVRGFGSDTRARVFFEKKDAEIAVREIDEEFGYHCYVTKQSDLYPPKPSWGIWSRSYE